VRQPVDTKPVGDTQKVAGSKQTGPKPESDGKPVSKQDSGEKPEPGKDVRVAASSKDGGLKETKDAFGGKLPTIKIKGAQDFPPRADVAGTPTDATATRANATGARTDATGTRTDATGTRADVAGIRADSTGTRVEGPRIDTTGARVEGTIPAVEPFVPLKGGIASDAGVRGSFETKPTPRTDVDPTKVPIQSDVSKPKDASKLANNQEPKEPRAASDLAPHAKGFTISGVDARSDRRDAGDFRNDSSNLSDEAKSTPRSIRDIFIKSRLPFTKRDLKPEITDSGTYRVQKGQSSQRLQALASSARLNALRANNDSSAALPAASGHGESSAAASASKQNTIDSIARSEEPRKWHIVKEGEDERFIASAYLNDESLAGLIKEINKPVFQAVYDVALQQHVEVLPVGAMILLPNATDIEKYKIRTSTVAQ